MHTSLVMLEKADNRAPDDYMEKVLKTYNTCWTAVSLDLATGKSGSLMPDSDPPTMERITELRNACTDPAVSIAYWFCKSDVEVHSDSMQPFIIVKDKEENPLVVALLAGEFKKYTPDGGDISGSFYYATDYLHTLFEDLMEQASNNIDELGGILDKKINLKNLQNSLAKDETLIIALADEKGYCRVFSGAAVENFDWGFTSDSLGWKEAASNPPTPDPVVEEKTEDKPLTGMALRVAQAKAKKMANQGPVTPTTSVTTVIPTPNISGTRTQDKLEPPKGATIETHPHWFYKFKGPEGTKQKLVSKAYEDALGFVPPNFMERPTIQRSKPIGSKLKDLGDLKQIVNTDSLKSNSGPPLILAQSVKHLTEEWVPKYFDASKRQIKSPWEAPKVEDKIAWFSELTGLGDVAYRAPVQARRELILNQDAFINLTCEMSDKLFKQQAYIAELEARLHEAGVKLLKSA